MKKVVKDYTLSAVLLFVLSDLILNHHDSMVFAKSTKAVKRNDMLEVASVSEGERIAVGCTGCHSIMKNGQEKVAPNLFNIVNSRRARSKKFKYSEAFIKQRGKKWTVDDLSEFLKDPESYIPGNKMTFSGLSDAQDRMDLIAYLMTLKK